MMSTYIEKEIRRAIEGMKELKRGVDVIGARLSDIDDRMSEPAYSKEFVDEFKECCSRLSAPKEYGGISMREMDYMFSTNGAYNVLWAYSAEEIVKKFREFDEKKKLELDQTFRIGDEVENKFNPKMKGIILENSKPDEDYITVWNAHGYVLDGTYKAIYKKTGRHFDSIDRWIETELKKEEKR